MRRIIELDHDEYVAIVNLIMNLATNIEKLPECETKLNLMSIRSKLLSEFDIAQRLPY